MIRLSEFRSAVVQEPLVKVAYVTPGTVQTIRETGTLYTDPGYLGSGCLIEAKPGVFQLKTVGVAIDGAMDNDAVHERAYRWVLDEEKGSLFYEQEKMTKAVDRVKELFDIRTEEGWFPPIDVWVMDDVTEMIKEGDTAVKAPLGVYRQYDFVTIMRYPLYDNRNQRTKDEYVCLVTEKGAM